MKWDAECQDSTYRKIYKQQDIYSDYRYTEKRRIQMKFKKGQGATEYLIILAVVIIVALIVVAAMGGIPGIGSGAKSRASDSFWESGDIAIINYVAFSASDNFNVTIRNNLVDTITVGTFTIGGGTQTCDTTSLASGAATDCTDADGASACSGQGDAFSHDVSIAYTNDQSGGAYTLDGEGHTLNGECAT